jgi:glycosyltransferase involved in cell wall biosynthesis
MPDDLAAGIVRHSWGPPAGKPKVLMIWAAFPPATAIGGPTRSAEGLVEHLGEDFEISVITSAYDVGHRLDVVADRWTPFNRARVWYSSTKRPSPLLLDRLVAECGADLIYANGLWHPQYSMTPLVMWLLGRWRTPLLLAPRGELSAGALAISRRKKAVAAGIYRSLGIGRRVQWHASTDMEQADIVRSFGNKVRCHVARNLRILETEQLDSTPRTTADDRLRLVFFSRIVPKKNLSGLLRALSLVRSSVDLTIAGGVQDDDYWRECEALITSLPPEVRVEVLGEIAADAVVSFLTQFDALVLPTHGENFGHVILEALVAGLPVIVGSDTPWADVEAHGAGWLVDSSSPQRIADTIDRFGSLDPASREACRRAAFGLGRARFQDREPIEANRAMFKQVAAIRASNARQAL